jgi:RNA polymerase sigma-70 factor (ECF subfamily)
VSDTRTTRAARTGRPASGASDADSLRLLQELRADGERRERALPELHSLLLKAARLEAQRRGLHGRDLDDLSDQAADDALVSVLRRLGDFRGESRFTTWAYKFAVLEAASKASRRRWVGREIPLTDPWVAETPGPERTAEDRELLEAVRVAVETRLTGHQRTVLVALALNDVPIDVLAERLGTTRGALYKTLHDARRKLREAFAEQGGFDGWY